MKDMVLRVNDLAPPGIDEDEVRVRLAARGIPVGDRHVPAGTTAQAVLTTTAAGVVVTLEQRSRLRTSRSAVLRRLTRELDHLLESRDSAARGSRNPPRIRTKRRFGGS